MYYLNVFLGYSIIGYLFEMLVCLIFKQKPTSGIMYGPWTPIYGIGILLILFINRFVLKFNMNKVLELIVFFILVVVILSLIEQLGGVLLDKLFHKTLWSYNDLKFHITKYVALEVSILWGGAAILIAYVIQPLINNLFYKVPFIVTAIAFIAFMIDAVVTFFKNI